MKNNKLKLLWFLFAFIGLFVISSCNNNNNSNDGDSNKTTQSATFTVTWKDGNGKVIETDRKVKYGDTPKYNGITPTKKATAQYEYTFSGWSPEIKEVTSDITYTAQFTESLVKYLISWNNEDGTLIKTTEVEYGKFPVFDGEEPTKESTVKYDYKFKGWYPELRAVTKNQSYKAQFDYADRYYNISFINYDGSLLYSEKAKAYKSISTYTLSKLKPTRENDDNYSYTFVGWTPSVSSAVCDQVYTAEYSKTQLPYTFKFNLNGGICLSGINDKKTNRLDKRDFKFDLQKNGKAFRGWEYRGQLIFDKNGNLKINSSNFTFSSIMEFDALYEDEYHVSIRYQINGTVYYELPEDVGTASVSTFVTSHSNVDLYTQVKDSYSFVGWYKNDSLLSKQANYTYGVYEEDAIICAKFSKKSYSLTVRTNNSELGEVQYSGETVTNRINKTLIWGTSVSIFAKTHDGDEFLGWFNTNDDTLVSTNEKYIFNMPSNDYSIEARFATSVAPNYSVEHYQQNISDYDYSLFETEVLSGLKGSSTEACGKDYEGFTCQKFNQAIIKGDGTTVIKIYYTRNMYKLTLADDYKQVYENANFEIVTYINTFKNYKYGEDITLDIEEYLGSTYVGLFERDKLLTNNITYSCTMPSYDMTIEIRRTLLPEMEPFFFTAGPDYFRVNGLKDGTVSGVVIPKCVTELSNNAFSSNKSVESIGISNNIEIMDKQVISNSSIENIYFDGSIEEWIYRNFLRCSLSVNLYFRDEEGTDTFFGEKYYLLSELIVPNNIAHVEEFAFNGCKSLTSVIIPEGVISIGDMAFASSNLKSIKVSNSVKSIGDASFENSGILHVYYDGTIEEWCDMSISGSLSYDVKLYFLDVNGDVVNYGNNYYLLKDLVIPSNVTEIKGGLFSRCSSIESIVIPSHVVSINAGAFSCCTSLKLIEISSGLKNIGRSAFTGCISLSSIEIPNSVDTIDEGIFCNCKSLQSISIPFIGAKRYTETDENQFPFGYLFGDFGTTGFTKVEQYYLGPSCKRTSKIYYIPTAVVEVNITDTTYIQYGAFYCCTSIKNIGLPTDLKVIGDFAFYGCSSLASIDFPDELEEINNYAFSGCSRLKSIVIPYNVKLLGIVAFSSCTSLNSVTITNNELVVPTNNPFSTCPITYANIPCKWISSVKNTNLTTVVLNSGTLIEKDSFSGCQRLERVFICHEVMSIEDGAFFCCYELDSVYYDGTKEDWNNINMGINNNSLIDDVIYYYSEFSPIETGKYWHYGENGDIQIW